MSLKGIIPINKPKDWTSFDVVNKLKYRLKPNKVGHLGTLDPMATGLLLITVGKATKLFDIMQEKTKTYVATFEFGILTDTLDATGNILEKGSIIPTESEILSVLPKFIGKIDQIPPKFSAKSINGQRAYDLARNNIEFELKSKQVEVYEIKLLSFHENMLKLEITCGSGTYIRSLGRDIAKELNTFATMTELVRTKIGQIDLNKSYDIQDIDNVEEKIIPIKDFLSFAKLELNKNDVLKILNGQAIDLNLNDGTYLLEDEVDVVALVKVESNRAKMSVFLG